MKVFRGIRQHTTHALHKKARRFKWYKKWHEFKYHRHVHWAVLALYIFGIALFIILQPAGKTLAALDQVTNTVSTQADFEAGTLSDTAVTNTSGGEVMLNGDGGAGWFDSSWQKRKPITITNTGALQTNYQVKITIPYDADMQADFDDVRFANVSGTPLDFWLQSKTDSTQATVWVEVDSLAASGDTTIYLYYSNAGASSGSNGENTFLLFDNFDDNSIDTNKWTEVDTPSEISEENGKLTFTGGTSGSWNQSVYSVNGFDRSNLSFEYDYIWTSDNPSYDAFMFGWKDDGAGYSYTNLVYGYYNTSTDSCGDNAGIPCPVLIYQDGAAAGTVNGSWIQNTDYAVRLRMKEAGGAYYEQSTDGGTNWTLSYDSSVSVESTLHPAWMLYAGTHLIDNARVRKWMSSEPTSVIGAEESALAPTGTWTSSSVVDSGILDLFWNGGWGTPNGFEADVNILANTSISFEIRSSDTGGADGNWSSWQSLGTIDEGGGTGDRTFSVTQGSMPGGGSLPIGTNRYIQVRATLASTDGISNPTLKEIRTIYMADQNAPTNPTTVNAWQDNTKTTGQEVTDNSWSSSQTPYFEWSGQADGVGESGIEGYWAYFGTDSTADPKTAGSWQTGANYTGSISLADSGKTYYLAISTEDYAENRYTNGAPDYYKKFTYKFDKTAPAEPSYITVDPVGWSVTNNFDFTWPAASDIMANGDASGIAGYQYKRETDADWSATTTDTFVNGIQAYQNGQNKFYVRSVDVAGNLSANSRVVNYYYNADAPSAPQSLGVVPPNSQENSFTFSWSLPASYNNSIKGYYYSINAQPNVNNTTYTTNDSTGAIAAATQQGFNTFYVVAMDSSDNISWGNYASVQFECNTPAPGIPTNVEVFDTSNRDLQSYKATINWQEPENKGVGFQGYLLQRSEDGVNFTQVGSSAGTSYVDTGLESKLYYYRVISKDNSGNTSAPSTVVSVTPTGRYTSPPNIITGPEISVKVSTADIHWVTDRGASSFVEIGENVGYGLTQGQFEFVVDHKVKIERLKADTIYHYRVKYVDEDGNIGYSQDATLKTLPAPTIADVRVEDIRLSTAVVSWETSAEAKSSIYFGKSAGYGMFIDDVSGGFTTNHSVRLTDLDHSSTYHYKIVIKDIDGNVTEGEDHTFETMKFPVISVVRMEPVNDRATATMKFTWETNVPTGSVVDYTPSGGSTQQAVDIKLKTKHEVVISGLLDNTFYTVKMRSRDQYGNEAVSDTQNFKTDYDTRPPKVSEVAEETSLSGYGIEAKGQAVISWQTDEPATSRVEYSMGVTGDSYSLSTQEDNTLTTSHIVVVPNLKPSSSYYFRAASKDASGNEGKSDEGSLLIEQSKSSVLELIFKSLNATLGWLFR